ncbi:hypothetical protein RR46_08225 [Papilio xuthus]|uniref:Uncharacterized protein n=1 Tax=Papilio xuthus TaxID=66420 RepID=A0A194QA72_PAPXU|nr:hypothetical protein RR46_08225 [Papilio xuthus]
MIISYYSKGATETYLHLLTTLSLLKYNLFFIFNDIKTIFIFNSSICFELQIQTRLSSTCLERILAYFWYTMRRGDQSLEKPTVVGNNYGRRSRGHSPNK